jgi:signal transduction histidine kinase
MVPEPAVGGAGAGLGLASARAEVERHGGHMAVQSALSKGTTVGFWVPTGEIAPVTWALPS